VPPIGRSIVVVLLVLSGTWWGWRTIARRHPGVAPADSLQSIDPKAAYLEGVELVRHGHHVESLAWFRHALALRTDLWQVHADYASALLNSTIQVAPHRGLPGPATRSSWERMNAIREALEHLDRAEGLAREPSYQATVLYVRSTLYANWGLFWNSAVDHRDAGRLDPSVLTRRPGEAVPATPPAGG